MNGIVKFRVVGATGWVILVVVAALLPFAVTAVHLVELQQVIYTAIAILSLNLLSGLAGQISIGQSAYVGLAAYATAIAVTTGGWSYWVALPLSLLIGFVTGALTGLPALRITGIRLAMATLSIAILFPTVPVRFTAETGGTAGFSAVGLPAPEWFPASTVAFRYWVLLLAAVVVFVGARNVIDSRAGRALVAIRDQPVAASTVGINVSLIKVLVFGFSGALCGLAGWMFVVANQFVSPFDFTVMFSIYLLVGMVIGGSRTLVGAVFGALFLIYAPNVIGSAGVTPLLTPVIYGVALILILLLLPGGVGGLLQGTARRMFGRSRRRDPAAATATPDGDDGTDESADPVGGIAAQGGSRPLP